MLCVSSPTVLGALHPAEMLPHLLGVSATCGAAANVPRLNPGSALVQKG